MRLSGFQNLYAYICLYQVQQHLYYYSYLSSVMLYINILFIIIVIGALIIDVLYLLFVLKSYIIFKYIIHLSNWNCFYLRFSSRKFLCKIKGIDNMYNIREK